MSVYSRSLRVCLFSTAVVTILQTDPHSGEQVVRTAAVLKKGNSFGVSKFYD